MGNLREFMLKKGNTKRSSPPAGAKGNGHKLPTLSLQSIATQSHKSRKLDEELTTQDCILTFVVVRKNRSAEKGNLN